MKWLQSLGELLGTTHLSYKARFTPVTKSNSTRSTLSKVSTVSHWRQTVSHWRQSQKDVRRSGDKNYPLSTQSTELNMFSFGDNVDRDKVEQADDSRLSTNRRHIRKYQRHSRESTLSQFWRLLTVTSVCVPGLRQTVLDWSSCHSSCYCHIENCRIGHRPLCPISGVYFTLSK